MVFIVMIFDDDLMTGEIFKGWKVNKKLLVLRFKSGPGFVCFGLEKLSTTMVVPDL